MASETIGPVEVLVLLTRDILDVYSHPPGAWAKGK